MALLFIDSFDHYTTLLQKWTTSGGDTAPSATSSSAVRFGTNGLRISYGNTSSYATKTLPSTYTTLITGFAFRISAFRAYSASVALFAYLSGGTRNVQLGFNTSGNLIANLNGTLITGGTGTTAVVPNVWHYLEIKVTAHDTTGAVTVKLNGATELALTNVDTLNGGSTYNGILLGSSAPSTETTDFDDVYVCDTSGSAPTNDFLGDVRVESLFPSGNGNSSQFVGSDANSTDNYLLVDEVAPSTADYVESATTSEKDTYAFGDLASTSGPVYAVQLLPYAAKTNAGVRSIASVARLSGTEVDSSDKALSVSYTYLPDIRETKPGGGAWSISDVNSAEFGVKVTV